MLFKKNEAIKIAGKTCLFERNSRLEQQTKRLGELRKHMLHQLDPPLPLLPESFSEYYRRIQNLGGDPHPLLAEKTDPQFGKKEVQKIL